MRWLYIPADVPTHAPDGDGRIFGARNRTHVCGAGGAAACTPIPISHTSTHIPIYMYSAHTYIDSYIYIPIPIFKHTHTYNPSFVSAAVFKHVHTRACEHNMSAHTRARASAVPPCTTARTAPTTSRLRWRAARAGKAART